MQGNVGSRIGRGLILVLVTMSVSQCAMRGTRGQGGSKVLTEEVLNSDEFKNAELELNVREIDTPEPVKAEIKESYDERKKQTDLKLTDPLTAAGTIINLGKKVWDIIKENAPVANAASEFANAVPAGADPFSMEGFSELKYKSFIIEGVKAGIKVYSVEATMVHQYGGKFQNKGHYIESASIIPSNINVAPFHKIDFKTTKVSVTNVGSAADPVAALAMHLVVRASSVVGLDEKQRVVQFRGDKPVAAVITP
jgi:hypothetical protein